MARRGVVRSAAEKQRLLGELEASGSSVAAFARERGLSAWTIYAWRKQVREDAGRQSPFVELQVASEPQTASTIELELPAGILSLLNTHPGAHAAALVYR